MSSYLEYSGRQYLLPSDCNLSVGNSCDTRERRMSDGSGTSYAITTFTKPQVNTYSLSFGLSISEYPDLIGELYKWESLVGKDVIFVYCGIPFGNVIVIDISASLGLDATIGLIGLEINLNLKDNIVLTNKSRINTRFE